MSGSTKKTSNQSPPKRSQQLGQGFEVVALKRLTALGLVRVETAWPALRRQQQAKVTEMVEALQSGHVVLGYGTAAEGLFWNSDTGRLTLVEVSGAIGTSDGRHGLHRGDSARKVVGSLSGAATVLSRAGLRPDGLVVTNGLPDLSHTAGCYLNSLLLDRRFLRFKIEWLSGWSRRQPQWTTLDRRALRGHLKNGQWQPRQQQYLALRAA